MIKKRTSERQRTAALPRQDFRSGPRAEENSLPSQTLQPACGCRKLIVVIIIFVWLIMTFTKGPDWLTPVEIAFFALLLNQSSPSQRAISG
jgi:hypothetical protein